MPRRHDDDETVTRGWCRENHGNNRNLILAWAGVCGLFFTIGASAVGYSLKVSSEASAATAIVKSELSAANAGNDAFRDYVKTTLEEIKADLKDQRRLDDRRHGASATASGGKTQT